MLVGGGCVPQGSLGVLRRVLCVLLGVLTLAHLMMRYRLAVVMRRLLVV